jgi:hypothetical protein
MIDENITPPTAEELAQMREDAYNATHPASWVWSEEATSWVAPVAQPTDGFPYLWDESSGNWIPFPDYPRN